MGPWIIPSFVGGRHPKLPPWFAVSIITTSIYQQQPLLMLPFKKTSMWVDSFNANVFHHEDCHTTIKGHQHAVHGLGCILWSNRNQFFGRVRPKNSPVMVEWWGKKKLGTNTQKKSIFLTTGHYCHPSAWSRGPKRSEMFFFRKLSNFQTWLSCVAIFEISISAVVVKKTWLPFVRWWELVRTISKQLCLLPHWKSLSQGRRITGPTKQMIK